MAAVQGNLNMVKETQNMTAHNCFNSQSTVLQGQPFGGIPTVLFLNVILWVVSPVPHGRQGGLGQTVTLSQVIQQGPRLSRQTSATVVGTP